MQLVKNLIAIIGMMLMVSVGVVLAVDGYELEQTAECKQCILLPYIKPNL